MKSETLFQLMGFGGVDDAIKFFTVNNPKRKWTREQWDADFDRRASLIRYGLSGASIDPWALVGTPDPRKSQGPDEPEVAGNRPGTSQEAKRSPSPYRDTGNDLGSLKSAPTNSKIQKVGQPELFESNPEPDADQFDEIFSGSDEDVPF